MESSITPRPKLQDSPDSDCHHEFPLVLATVIIWGFPARCVLERDWTCPLGLEN